MKTRKTLNQTFDELSLELGLSIRGSIGLDPGCVPGAAGRDGRFDGFEPEDPRYRILRKIGAGGMGSVFLAFDTDLNRKVALKVSHLEDVSDGPATNALIGEARTTGRLEHPNIVPVHDIGATPQGDAYYVMRYVEGKVLSEVIEALLAQDVKVTRSWSLTRLLQVFQQVCWAVEHAHRSGIVHHDLKPANVMLGDCGEVLVVDWGLARALEQFHSSGEGSEEGRVVGTPAYMAPEQVACGPAHLDHRSDIYSLGVILYELLCYRKPFESKTLKGILDAIRFSEPLSPRHRDPQREIPRQLEAICLKAMHKEPAGRFGTAGALGEAVQAYLETQREVELRRQQAGSKVLQGVRLIKTYEQLARRLEASKKKQERLGRQFRTFDRFSIKRPYYEAVSRTERLQSELSRVFIEAANELTDALAFTPEDPTAREHLADLYFTRYLEAERDGDMESRAFFRNLTTRYHDGKYAGRFEASCAIKLETLPRRATALLYRFEEKELVLTPVEPEPLGKTPVEVSGVAPGSYLVELASPGYRTCRYPVVLERDEDWQGSVKLWTDKAIGEGFIHIPAGPYRSGGDALALSAETECIRTLGDYFIMERHVTLGEYLAFVQALHKADPGEAEKRAPRRESGQPILCRDAKGRYRISGSNISGAVLRADWPVLCVTRDDMLAYIRWRSSRDGRTYYLPTSDEWEKAARGVDGRLFPWGNTWENTFCNNEAALRARSPRAVKQFPIDCSVYGVFDAAGNAADMCRERYRNKQDGFVIRGGSWPAHCSKSYSRLGSRNVISEAERVSFVGFRLVHYPVCGPAGTRHPGNRARTQLF